jgi:hypothetical protein
MVFFIKMSERDGPTRFFWNPVFFSKRFILVPIDMPRSDTKFFSSYSNFKCKKIQSPVHDSGKSKLSLRQPIFWTLLTGEQCSACKGNRSPSKLSEQLPTVNMTHRRL